MRRFIGQIKSILFLDWPERLYDGYLQKIDQLQVIKTRDARCLWARANQLQGRHPALEAMSPLHRIEAPRIACSKNKRVLTSRVEQVLRAKIKVKGLSEALLMLDTSRIIACGYAMVKEGDRVLDSVAKVTEGDPLSSLRDDPS